MTAPSRIGPYAVEREIGRGGMGVVYLGRDARLGREVAIKMLPEGFSLDAERVQRFEREARLLASLSHPNIAGIYGLEEQDGQRYLVLEYVPGETLAERIARGPLPVDDAADVCRQIAAALETAHESGVVHRDLKPGNVKITPAGEVKVLDFGLAKGGGAASGVSVSDMTHSPTLTAAATGAGVILGTAAYMSPEQARGRAVDRRTDIWSFGCVMFECLTGKRAFEGETVSDMIALILQGSPDWKALPATTPARVRALLERCLEKDPKKRLRDIGEAELVLEAPHDPISGVHAAASLRRPARPTWLALAGVSVALAAFSGWLGWRLAVRSETPASVSRLQLLQPTGPGPLTDAALAALSPDGSALAFVNFDSIGSPALWIRRLDELQAQKIAGTDGCLIPAWSPDGRSLVLGSNERLMRVDLRGGAPQALAECRAGGRGSSWGSRGDIVFARGAEGPLYKVAAGGGPVTQVTQLDSTESAHRFPEFLPDGVHFLYAALPARASGYDIFVGSTDGRTRVHLMNAGGVPRYADPGWLVYPSGGRLLARRFDAAHLRLAGEVMSLTDEAARTDYEGASPVLVPRSGPIAYFPGGLHPTDLAVFDRSGRRLRTLAAPEARYNSLAVSPDEQWLAVNRLTSPTESDLWLIDLVRGGSRRVNTEGSLIDRVAWSFDSRQLACSERTDQGWRMVVVPLAGGESRVVPTPPGAIKLADSWSPDGRTLVVQVIGEKSGWDLWACPTDGSSPPVRIVGSAYDEFNARVSPDGRWLSFVSTESGRPQVYVQSFPVPASQYQISTAGGDFGVWAPDSRSLAYRSGDGTMKLVRLNFEGGVQVAATTNLLDVTRPQAMRGAVTGDVSASLAHLYMSLEREDVHAEVPFVIVQNWKAALAEH